MTFLSAATLITTVCSSKMTVDIPKCILNGLNVTDLMFNDASCDLAEFTTETDLFFQITVPFGRCGRKMQVFAFIIRWLYTYGLLLQF